MPDLKLIDRLREFLATIQGREIALNEIRAELRIAPDSVAWDSLRELMRIMITENRVKYAGKKGYGVYLVITQVAPVIVFGTNRQRRPPVKLHFPKDWTSGLELPFAEHIVVREGDLITIGGVKSTGKTLFCLSFCAENIDSSPVLLGNEYTIMSKGVYEPAPRFLERLDLMSGWVNWTNGTGQDKFVLLPVREDFAEHVIPDRLNILDWINIDASQLYDIGKVLAAVKSSIGRGIAIAALQKGEGAINPRGGQFVRDFSDLEILLDPFGNNPRDILLTIKGIKEAKKPIAGKTYSYTIGEHGTKIFNFREVRKCRGCSGSGQYKGHDCDQCSGTGFSEAHA